MRRVGPDSNGSFAGYLRPNHFGPVALHPDTRRPIPALATHWAFGDDRRSIYYRLNPEARWSDGVPVTAGDFVFAEQFMRSDQTDFHSGQLRRRLIEMERNRELEVIESPRQRRGAFPVGTVLRFINPPPPEPEQRSMFG